MHALTGYCDRWSVKPGGTIRFMVSSTDDLPFQLRFVRHLCADPNPDGPGYREQAMPTLLDGPRQGSFQPAWLGSWGYAPALHARGSAGLALAATVWPTLPEAGEQGVVSLAAEGWRFSAGLDADGAFAEVAAPGGRRVRASVGTPLLRRRWYDLVAVWGADGTVRVGQYPRRASGGPREDGEASAQLGQAPPDDAVFGAYLAALPPGDPAGRPARAHFNGKLERPTVWRAASDPAALARRQRDPVPGAATPGLVACWDFATGPETDVAADTGPHRAHARLTGLPTRAMTGASWTGEQHDWARAPGQYAAIHFHEDDQGDLGWQESFALEVPADWPSGFYSAHLRSERGEDHLAFFVRPAAPRAPVALLVPTFTYQVYGCFVRPGRAAENRERAASWGALLETPDTNPQFGLSTYNQHSDGSGVALASMRRPMLDTRPRQMALMDPAERGSGTARICCDSYIADWLDRIGVACDVLTDHDLHDEGAELLAPYRTVIAAQHPEYHSARMMAGLETFLEAGGRLMYLGGNGFYWRAEPSPAQPHALEVRRAEGGIRVWATEAGESYHAHGGGYGGLWRRIGRPAHGLVGNGFSAQGRHLGFPYRFTGAAGDPRVAFMVQGIEAAPGQVFGESGFMGGGAVGFELDSADARWGTPPHALVVAKGVVIHEDYFPVNEDLLATRHPRPREDWSCADMVFFETPAGGAVFSVGSMTYVGSLPVDQYRNTLCRLTENVLRRFMEPEPFG